VYSIVDHCLQLLPVMPIVNTSLLTDLQCIVDQKEKYQFLQLFLVMFTVNTVW
jgi:hypothetical protein